MLDSKTELEKAMSKQRLAAAAAERKEKERSPLVREEGDAVFKKVLAERAARLEKVRR